VGPIHHPEERSFFFRFRGSTYGPFFFSPFRPGVLALANLNEPPLPFEVCLRLFSLLGGEVGPRWRVRVHPPFPWGMIPVDRPVFLFLVGGRQRSRGIAGRSSLLPRADSNISFVDPFRDRPWLRLSFLSSPPFPKILPSAWFIREKGRGPFSGIVRSCGLFSVLPAGQSTLFPVPQDTHPLSFFPPSSCVFRSPVQILFSFL